MVGKKVYVIVVDVMSRVIFTELANLRNPGSDQPAASNNAAKIFVLLSHQLVHLLGNLGCRSDQEEFANHSANQ